MSAVRDFLDDYHGWATADAALQEHEAMEAELARLREEGQKDYDDMRRFQAKYIEADQENARLREALERIADIATPYQDMPHIARNVLKGDT